MILLIGLTLSLSIAIAIYFLRQWFMTFRPQAEPLSSSISKPPGYTALISTLFYLLILPLSYMELLLEMYRDRDGGPKKRSRQKPHLRADHREMSEY